jgi:acetylornithine deacetylase/succinyl-diaminopimelate desuccinylase-like protein
MTLDARRLLERLVAIPSVNPPGDERAIAEAVVIACDELLLPPARTASVVEGRPNVVLRVGAGEAPRLLLVGHLDTMPVGDLSAWMTDPFQLTERQGRLYGLGAADMKASIAAVLVALARFAPRLGAGTIELVLTADEEGGSAAGMRSLISDLAGADHAVVLEPSGSGTASWQHLYVAELGSCVVRLEASGEPGHSGLPVPAERRASYPLSVAMRSLIDEQPFHDFRHPVDGSPPIVNVGTMVSGGATPYAHPPSLSTIIEVRTHFGMDAGMIMERLQRVLTPVEDRVSLTLISETPPGKECTDERLLATATAAWREVIGSDPRAGVLRAGTDGAYLSEVGIPTIPAFGPGSLGVAHAPNEFVPVEDLETACNLYEVLLDHYFAGRTA